ncbi:hypothetical protein ACFZCP_34795 [Streptomyces sp. NPDC007971]|uniref:hypothetical protein n=1 Tax=Streptomyces sp. NPDC007971 TaxID=3364799 RepID=UPI0036E3429D
MWPDQQPPGGAQNPQQNPYQQPGYQQPNPYQQPGYQQYPQAGGYGQQPQWGQQQPPTAPMQQPPQGGGGRAKLIAVIAAAAVVITAGVTGFLVLGGSKDDKDNKADGGKGGGHASQSPTQQPTATSSSDDSDPRGNETEKPTIAGWKVVVNPKWGVAFDVPADWEVQSPGLAVNFDFPKSEKDTGITMSGLAEYKSKWCTSDDDKDGRSEDTPLAVVGSKGASGAKNSDQIAINTPPWWVYGGYTMPDKKSISWDKKATPFKSASGVQGSYAWAQSIHTPRKGKCVTDGKALTFGFQNSAHDFVSFDFYGATGVKGEIPKATVLKVLSTIRLHGTPTSD